MNFFNNFRRDIEALIKSKSITESIIEIKECAISDTVSMIPYGQTIITIIKTVHDIPLMIFWSKIERFLRGIDILTLEERQKLSRRFVEDGYPEYTKRLLCLIDKIDIDDKIDIISNFTRALAQDLINTDMYFRLIHSVKNTLYEDLLYLGKNVRNKNIELNINIDSLSLTGLAYQSVIDGNGENKYEISDLGINVVIYGIKYNEMNENKDLFSLLGSKMSISTGMKPLSPEDIEFIIDEI